MILFLNGAFGIGKTAVAQALVARIPGALLFDPEKIGIPLQRTASLLGRDVADFQDLRAWRTLTVVGLRLARMLSRNVIVPMAFSNPAYLRDVRSGAARFEPALFHFCLVAPVDVVHERLRRRGADPARHAWQYRRASECCAVHGAESFAQQLVATDRTPNDLAEHILDAIGYVRAAPLPNEES